MTLTSLDDVIAESARHGMWAHVATVTPDGGPHVVPVHPCWFEDRLYALVGPSSKKMRNLARNPEVCVHWQVSEQSGFDSLIVWGTGAAVVDVERKQQLWDGAFDYDLSSFSPAGPTSPDTGFLEIVPLRALVLRQFGTGGREEWRAG